ncbi:MAG: PD-(D/E)XK nuclease family protein [Micrococcales bacterium]|nr:PD-(D/E)XK nuclease family protein [Micrococcales bacterium]
MSRPSLSPSRAADFERCPLLYRLRVIDRLVEPPSAAALRGSLVHLVLEELFDLPAPKRTPVAAHGLLPQAVIRLEQRQPDLDQLFATPQERQDWLKTADDLVESYFYLEDPASLRPHHREFRIEAQLEGGLTLRGYIDRVDVAAATGAVRIVDYKTGKSPSPRFQGEALFQLRFYALAWWRRHGQLPAQNMLLYLGNRDILREAPSQGDLERTELKVLTLWDAIAAAFLAANFPPVQNPLCNWCAFQAQCPVFGGVLPPFPADAGARLGL